MSAMRNKIAIVIPAYEPEDSLLELIKSLQKDFGRIVVIDDGSKTADAVFERVAWLDGVKLLRHDVNRGKGAALKTAFAAIPKLFPDVEGVVTADADGQHLPEDIAAVAKSVLDHPDRFTLGVRGFDGNVPLRSRFGNAWSRWFFFLLTGAMIYDTQTGLRGIPTKFLPALCEMKGDRYEYEGRMLVAAARMKAKPQQIRIKTVYLEGNRTSHFNPIRDSLRTQMALLAARFSPMPKFPQ
jgi:glycosyltransferase involved in cell wall biosynthesis